MPDSSAARGAAGRPHDPYAALRLPEFRAYLAARFALTLALQMQGTVVGYQVYKLTHDALSLGLIGLAEAIPSIGVALVSGYVADTVPRRRIVRLATLGFAVCTALLWSFVLPGAGGAGSLHNPLGALLTRYGAAPIYAVIFLSGLTRGFISPALFSFMPQLIADRAILPNAVTWSSTSWQTASVLGPALGGLLLGFAGVPTAYGVDLALTLLSLVILSVAVKGRPLPPRPADAAPLSLRTSLTTGLRFIFQNQLILASISLDLFAVLFGGAVALLPVFAERILVMDAPTLSLLRTLSRDALLTEERARAMVLGLLRAAPGVGSVAMLAVLNYLPVRRRAGIKLLAAVAGFGLATIAFAYATNVFLSLFLLVLTGAFDAVSVILRSSLLQLYTPDDIKGRVAAVNSIFIGSSNEIGAFESGAVARLLGTQPSVAFGGLMTLLVVAVTAWRAKALRRLEM